MTTTTDTVWREIDNALLMAALQDAFGVADDRAFTGVTNQTQDVSEDLIRAIVAHLEEGDLVCDHSVNVCACGARETLEDLTLWLSHKRTCGECGGDGFHFVGYDAEYDIEQHEPCPRCERGYVTIP